MKNSKRTNTPKGYKRLTLDRLTRRMNIALHILNRLVQKGHIKAGTRPEFLIKAA
jgi:hypothetical protein